MKIISPDYYKEFKCIAGDCPDSCCQGWEVDADEDSLEYYKTLSPELEIKRRIDSVLDKDEFGNTIFTLAKKKRCPFLNDENLCDMHIAIGGEHTPMTCRNFPRFFHNFGGTREIGISFSCPVASKLIYNHKGHITFDEEITDELPTLNDIDAETYFRLRKERGRLLEIAQDESISISERMLRMLEGYEDREKTDNTEFFDVFNNPELINEEWRKKVANADIKPILNSQANENILVYFLYKYFLYALEDGDALGKIKMAVMGVLINSFFSNDEWSMHLWSKETEHSQYNMDRYIRLLKEAKYLSKDNLIKLIKSEK